MSGPYMNEDGDWWVAVEDFPTLKAARANIVGCLSYEIPEDGTLVYHGKHRVSVCDEHEAHEVGPGCGTDDDGVSCSRDRLCWEFRENRRW